MGLSTPEFFEAFLGRGQEYFALDPARARAGLLAEAFVFEGETMKAHYGFLFPMSFLSTRRVRRWVRMAIRELIAGDSGLEISKLGFDLCIPGKGHSEDLHIRFTPIKFSRRRSLLKSPLAGLVSAARRRASRLIPGSFFK